MKNIHPKMEVCTYVCASCGTSFEILSTKGEKYSLDVCSSCHPYYVGNPTATTLRGRAEKLADKFATGKKAPVKEKKQAKSKASDVIDSFESL